MVTASTGTATIRPITPRSEPITRTLAMVSTGGRETLRSMMSGATRFASATWTRTPRPITATTLTQSPVPTTNSAGSRVETMVQKKGTTATSQVNAQNANQNATQ